MPDNTHDHHTSPRKFRFWRTPLFRLRAINLAAGIAVAALLVGGLLLLDPGGLRHLILADRVALGLLLFGFAVTFGSAAMGSAIMALGRREGGGDGPRGQRALRPRRCSDGIGGGDAATPFPFLARRGLAPSCPARLCFAAH
ncbi:MAG: hypothetical protein JWP25_8766 [Bradyrhizobium sp.]|nr:hypothetical protein [Bradyrhizobium sp.]